MAKKNESNMDEDVEDILLGEPEDLSWATQFKQESIDKAIKQDILPELKPRKNATYEVILLTLPRKIESTKGTFYVVTIDNGGLHQTMKANQSFLFGLESLRQKNNLSYRDLINRKIIFQKDEEGMMNIQM